MKLAYVHIFPVEYYPPATNAIRLLAADPDIDVSVWTSDNRKGRTAFALAGVAIHRPKFVDPKAGSLQRMWSWLSWNWQCARAMKRARVDAILYIEPHSAVAAWIYYKLLRGRARLLIHHHEYYPPEDYQRPNMRFANMARRLEEKHLLQRAEWISQTNANRLAFMQRDNPHVPPGKFTVWPNYPPRSWQPEQSKRPAGPLRLLYLGSASFETTYIREAVEWAARHPERIHLTICGYNIDEAVWAWLREQRYPNVALEPRGWDYDDLPRELPKFDVGLILYRGHVANFVYNAPNKLFEYWACGLEVWYPAEMKQITELAESQATPPLRMLDFRALADWPPPDAPLAKLPQRAEFSCDFAIEPLIKRAKS